MENFKGEKTMRRVQTPPQQWPTKLVISTDIGTDIDDALAVYLAATNPSIDLKAVWVTNGDVKIRARIAQKLLSYCGSHAEVWLGEETPLGGKQKPYMLGYEHQFIEPEEHDDFTHNPIQTDGLTHLISLLEQEKELVLSSIAPLTNIAKLIQKQPEHIAHVKNVYVMACRDGKLEHNIRYDIPAARAVFDSNLPITIISGNICDQYRLESTSLLYGLREGRAEDFINEMAFAWHTYKQACDISSLIGELKNTSRNIPLKGNTQDKIAITAILHQLPELIHQKTPEAYSQCIFYLTILAQNPAYSFLKQELQHIKDKTHTNDVAVHDAYTIYGILNPDSYKTTPVQCRFDNMGTTTIKEGGPHQWVTTWDYKGFATFLQTGLGTQKRNC